MITLVSRFLDYSRSVKAYGTYEYERTISNYVLTYFNNVRPEDLTLEQLQDFIAYSKSKTELSNKTINKIIKFLRALVKFGGYDIAWLNDFKLLKESKRRFDKLSDDELKKIFNYLNKIKSRGNAEQYVLMIYLLFDSGIRQSELLNIKLEDMILKDRHIVIKARKSIEDRSVFLSNDMMKRLSTYKPIANNDGLLFYNHLRDRPFNRNDMKLFYRRVKRATGIKKLHSHMFRHTYATDLIELDVPLFVVQKQLGHASITTTQIYYHASLKFQREEMAKIADIR